jgi:hypothetical protein
VALHNYRGQVTADYEGLQDNITDGKRPNLGYIPRFRNVYKQETHFLKGYPVGLYFQRVRYTEKDGIGSELKENLKQLKNGPW